MVRYVMTITEVLQASLFFIEVVEPENFGYTVSSLLKLNFLPG